MRRRWLWPLIVLALAALVWWAERGASTRRRAPVEPVRGSGTLGPAGEMRPAPPPAVEPAPAAGTTSPPR